MAGQQAQVTLDGMKRAESSFANTISEASKEAADIDNTSSALVTAWTGAAANTYQQAIAEWQSQFGKARQALQRMHAVLQQNTNQYTQTHTTTQDSAAQAKQHMTAFPGLPNL